MAEHILFRRHAAGCKLGVKLGREYIKCKCPIWCDAGRDETGKRALYSMKTRDWDRAERRMLGPDSTSPIASKKTLAESIEAYLADCAARHLKPSTVVSYRNTLHDLREFCGDSRAVNQIGVDQVTEFRQSRKARDGNAPMEPASQRKELEHLRAFWRFCVARDWTPANPAAALKPPRETNLPTLPFERDEIEKILGACDRIENNNRASAERACKRARALILVLLYAGLRISDAAVLERSRLDAETRRLMIRVMKTGALQAIRLHQSAVDALEALPVESKRYYFWSGNGKPDSIIGSLRRTVECVLKLAGVKGHPHRFRDTFAVNLLENDTPIRTVQLLLGHSSVQTTERHYAPFLKAQQRLLDTATDKLDFEAKPRAPGNSL